MYVMCVVRKTCCLKVLLLIGCSVMCVIADSIKLAGVVGMSERDMFVCDRCRNVLQ